MNRAKTEQFYGKPIKITVPWHPIATDGPLTVALDIRGDEIFSDMYLDSDYYHQLMDLIVTGTIERIRFWRKYYGEPLVAARGFFADDAIQMISTDTYREFVLPYHKRLFSELYGNGPHFMHICGNVQRHFSFIAEQLNVNHFDTGYPIDFNTLRGQIGPDIHISGGVHIDILQNGAVEDIHNEVKRILDSGVASTGKFIMKEANNTPPCTPVENIAAMYEAVKKFGRYV